MLAILSQFSREPVGLTDRIITMDASKIHSSDVAFTPTVKAVQARKGSRGAYARVEAAGGWETLIDSELTEFVEAQSSVFLATANAEGQPYIQHRGGPPGFLRVLDEHTIGFVDFAGNRQYITAGNLSDNPKVCLFLMDYAERKRVKIWGHARVVEGDAELVSRLMPPGYDARAEHVILITVLAWDVNCRQHIPQKFDAAEVAEALGTLKARIAELEAENARLKR
jgi:predicted pyridoxine 5'-phosphate oxidase superfamily flavin-nucleotide-binding protein